MMGRTHVILGLAAAYWLDQAFPYLQPPVALQPLPRVGLLAVGVGAAALGSLLPDIDHGQSSIAYQTGTAEGQGCLTDGVFGLVRRALGGHRALTHSVWAGLVLASTAIVCLVWPGRGVWSGIVAAFVIGYLAHILGDLLTREGVKFLYPLSGREWGLGLIKTGHLLEPLLALGVTIVTVGRVAGIF